jgi:hypothetical protein
MNDSAMDGRADGSRAKRSIRGSESDVQRAGDATASEGTDANIIESRNAAS